MSEYLVLYRKYRPKIFEEVVGQEHVVKVLQAELAKGKVSHAYLFSGPRGSGKTTIARLLAKAVNCVTLQETGSQKQAAGLVEPCNACGICAEFNSGRSLDLIEIDAASNRGIDEVRELREGVKFSPGSASKKVYIIDECHQLTKEAFNALLKTLEEPPQHAIFILATTEFEKVLPTIVSRTQHFQFRKLRPSEIVGRLQKIAKKEGRKVDPQGLLLIARAAGGAMRDAESILGQVFNADEEEMSINEVRKLLALPAEEAAGQLISAFAKKDAHETLRLIRVVTEEGRDIQKFTGQVISTLRAILLLKIDPLSESVLRGDYSSEEVKELKALASAFTEPQLRGVMLTLIDVLPKMQYSPFPFLPLELSAMEIISRLKAAKEG